MQITLGLAFVVTSFFQQLLQGQPAQNPPAPLPPDVFRVGGGVTPPTVLTRVEPEYSEAASTAGIQGTVVLEAFISEDGIARVTRVVRSLGAGLDENAIKAIEQWRFRPGTKDGKPVNVSLNIEVNFILGLPPANIIAPTGAAREINRIVPERSGVTALALDPSSANTIYAGTKSGVYKTVDGGGNWRLSSSFVDVVALTTDPTNPSVLYGGSLTRGIFKSTDGGVTWRQLPQPGTRAIQVDPSNSAILYAATIRGISKSVEGGNTWMDLLPAGSFFSALAVVPAAPTNIYAVSQLGALFKSADGGTTWRNTSPQMDATAVAVDRKKASVVYVGNSRGLFKSEDGGSIWMQLPGWPAIRALQIDPAYSDVIYAGTARGVLKSTDGGNTPTDLLPAGSFSILAIGTSFPAMVYAVTDSGNLFRSGDAGTTWRLLSGNLTTQSENATTELNNAFDPVDPSLPAPALVAPPEGAIFDVYPRLTKVRWNPSPGAVSYLVEWDYSYNGAWHTEDKKQPGIGYTVQGTEFSFEFVGAQPGRWRVFPINAAGQRGTPSDWRTFRYTR